MPRIRTIKPDFFKSERIESFSSDTVRLLFIGLWTYVDDYGRGRDDARLVKAELFPLREDMTTGAVEKILVELADHGVVFRYQVSGKRYLHVTNWAEHQRVSRPTESRFPNPEDGEKQPSEQPKEKYIEESMENIEESEISIEASCQEREQGNGKGIRKREEEVEASDEARRLSDLLADLIAENGSLRPNVTDRWITAIRLMITKDSRTPEQIENAIRWSQNSEFWRTNILSTPKLREKYDQLRLQALAEKQKLKPGEAGINTIQRMYNTALEKENNATI